MRKPRHSNDIIGFYKQLCLAGLFFLSTVLSLSANAPLGENGAIIFVYADAGGANDGSSWADAYTSLQTAIDNAVEGDEIWVAKGLYYPTTDNTGNASPTDVRTKTFYFNKNIGLYGGFRGTETLREQRNVEVNICLLSGDLEGNDLNLDGDDIAEDVTHIIGSNSYHVMEVIDRNANTVVDGFTFTAGKADNNTIASGTEGGGILIRGGYFNTSNPVFANCSFSGNYSDYAGGAVSLLANGDGLGNGNVVSPDFTNCIFFANNSPTGSAIQMEGANGGVANPTFVGCTFESNDANAGTTLCRAYGVNSEANPLFDRCYFISNESTGFGGAIYINAGTNATCSPTISNSIISNNDAYQGGFAYVKSESNGITTPSLVNCTIISNASNAGGAVIACDENTGTCAPQLWNSIVYSGNIDPFISNGAATITVGNSILEQSTLPAGVTDGGGNLLNTNPDFTDLGSGDYTLSVCSPAVDAGGDAGLVIPTIDMGGNDRVINGQIDIGAFELTSETTAPTVLTQNITIALDASGTASITAPDVDNGSFDNCALKSLELDQTDFDCAHLGDQTVQLSATDNWNNSNAANATVTVVDEIAPTVLTQNASIFIDEDGLASLNVDQIDNGSTDNCSISSRTIDVNTFNCDQIGEHTVSLTVSDASGNELIGTALVTVADNSAPSVVTKNVTASLNASGLLSIGVDDIDNGSTDNCGIATRTLAQNDFDCNHVGEQVVTLTVEDLYGNTQIASATVTVVDDTAPVVLTKNASVTLDETGEANITIVDIDNGSTDNCAIATRTLDQSDFDCNHIGEQVVTLIVEDLYGNTQTATAMVTVVDDTAPVILTKDISVTLDETGEANITIVDIDNGSTDNCTIFSSELDITKFTCDNLGTNVVNLSVTDGMGNSQSATAMVTVVDNSLPVVKTTDLVIDLDEDGYAGISTAKIDDGSFDNCGISTMELDITEFNCDMIGTHTVTLTVTDVAGNIQIATAQVTVEDKVDPVIATQNRTVYLDVDGQVVIDPSVVDNGTMDNCANWTLSLDQTEFDCDAIGEHTVTLRAEDASGNWVTETATITVVDDQGPKVIGQDVTIEVTGNEETAIVADDVIWALSDNCGIASIELDQYTFSGIHTGEQEVTITVVDVNGNSTTVTVTVTVNFLTDASSLSKTASLQVEAFPNPVENELLLDLSHAKLGQAVQLRVLNAQGMVSKVYTFDIQSETHQERLLLGDLPVGLYYIEISQADERRLLPVVRQ